MIEKRIKRNEQAIPMQVFNEALLEYLETCRINKNELMIKIKSFHKGENRAKKALNSIFSTITLKSALSKFLSKNITQAKYNKLSEYEQNLICIALLCLRFPFYYEILFVLGKLFAIQDSVNKRHLTKAITSKFGSNAGISQAISAALKNFVELEVIKKIKRGLYGKPGNYKICDLVKEIWISVFFMLNNGKKYTMEDLKYEPFIYYIGNVEINFEKCKLLHIDKDFCGQVWVR